MSEYAKSLEREVKIMLTEAQYNEILGKFKWDESEPQINHYYLDDEGRLSRERINVRVREKGGKCYLQVKALVKNYDGGPSVHTEVEREITSVPQSISAEEVMATTGIETGCAVHKGELVTLRSLCRYDKDIEICLDKSEYLGVTDYELEIEYLGERLDDVLAIAHGLGLDTSHKPKGKMTRFYQRLDEIENA